MPGCCLLKASVRPPPRMTVVNDSRSSTVKPAERLPHIRDAWHSSLRHDQHDGTNSHLLTCMLKAQHIMLPFASGRCSLCKRLMQPL